MLRMIVFVLSLLAMSLVIAQSTVTAVPKPTLAVPGHPGLYQAVDADAGHTKATLEGDSTVVVCWEYLLEPDQQVSDSRTAPVWAAVTRRFRISGKDNKILGFYGVKSVIPVNSVMVNGRKCHALFEAVVQLQLVSGEVVRYVVDDLGFSARVFVPTKSVHDLEVIPDLNEHKKPLVKN